MKILICAGEASGEMYGAELIRALCRSTLRDTAELRSGGQSVTAFLPTATKLEFFGVGGQAMRAAGCDTIFDVKELAVVGISEIVSHLPKIWRRFHQLIAEADKRKPDLAIVIDSPAFNWRVARQMHKRGIPVVYYVCPQFWAWRQGRVRLLQKYVDKALVIFPFEEQFYRDRGVDAEFVGHPLADMLRPTVDREKYASEHKLDPEKQWITLMPGSRVKEVRMNLPGILESAERLGPEYEFLLPVAPTLEPVFLKTLIGNRPIHLVRNSLEALSLSRAGIIASGTATVEAALMGTPFVMVYRVTPLTYVLGRWRVKVPHFAMVNLIAGKEVVPELVQSNFTAENVVSRLREILVDGPAREQMIQGLEMVRAHLNGSGISHTPAPERAADVVISLLSERKTSLISA